MPLRCLIVDDEAPARDELRYLLSRQPDVEIVAEAASAAEAVEACRAYTPSLVFLDIQMPGEDGFGVVRTLTEQMLTPPLVVFVTAFDNHAIKAFEASAIDYILKPVAESRLADTLIRARRHLGSQDRGLQDQLASLLAKVTGTKTSRPQARISVEKNGRIHLLDPRKVAYFEHEGHRILAHTREEIVPIHGITCMERMEEHLEGTNFFRAHRSTLVNLDAIREYSPWFNGKYSLIMQDGQESELTVSRNRVKDFKQRLGL